MSEVFDGRIGQLLRNHPGLSGLDKHLFVNAFCIDLTHGAAYAWAYLTRSGVPQDEIGNILRYEGENEFTGVEDLHLAAAIALNSVGLGASHNGD